MLVLKKKFARFQFKSVPDSSLSGLEGSRRAAGITKCQLPEASGE
jgi:hypothetical protein